jgi:hypothetical protein
MPVFSRAEVEAAYRHFVAVGDSGDWNAWADLHSSMTAFGSSTTSARFAVAAGGKLATS